MKANKTNSATPPHKPRFALISLGVFLLLAFLAGIFSFFIMGIVKQPDPSELSFAAVQKNNDVQQLVGMPMKKIYSSQGQLNVQGDGKGFAALKYEITGPKGEAHVIAWAVKSKGKWQIVKLMVLSSNNKTLQIINLNSNENNDFLKLFSPSK